jgi:hypothetical protein
LIDRAEVIMAYIAWKELMSVDVETFNEDHKRLVVYVNELHSGLVCGYKPLMRIA